MAFPDSSSSPPARVSYNGNPLFLRRGLLLLGLLLLAAIASMAMKWHRHRGWLANTPPAATAADVSALHGAPHTQLLVVGGTPAGVAAALDAARRGAQVTLIEPRPKLGGDIVYAMLNMFDVPMDTNGDGNSPVARGIFGQFYRKLGTSFSIEKANRLITEAVATEPNIKVLMQTRVTRVFVARKRLVGVEYQTLNQPRKLISFDACVDATNDADVAAMAGAKFDLGREAGRPDKLMQSVGLCFSVKNVNWKQVAAYVRSERQVPYSAVKEVVDHPHATTIDMHLGPSKNGHRTAMIREGGVVNNYAWERGDAVQGYVPHGPDIIILSINFGREPDGTVVLNTLNVLGVDGLIPAERARAHAEAAAEIPPLLDYLRGHMPGFENAELAQVAPELYIRETRHLRGVYMLKAEDVIKGVRFWDRIGMCSYPLDLHPYKRGEPNPYGPQRYYYTLPLRALVPKTIDGVFVASRSLSATWTAAGSARVIPSTMTAGEGAGAAAWVCAQNGVSPHELLRRPDLIYDLQQSLRHVGVNIGDKYPKKGVSHNEFLLAHQPHYSIKRLSGKPVVQ